MSFFSFYYGEDRLAAEAMHAASASVWGEVQIISRGSFRLFVPVDDVRRSFWESESALGAVSGYVRSERIGRSSDERQHNAAFVSEIVDDDNWPLGAHWTGSFASVAYAKASGEVVVCNDPFGHHPLYYSVKGGEVFGGTSLIVLGRCLAADVDPVGVLQRITSPYCNYGSRTLFKRVSRLLPGQWTKFRKDTSAEITRFDNSLCKGLLGSNVDEVAHIVWECLRREIELATSGEARVAVALSGGWDSRVALGGLTEQGRGVDCYTYGGEELSESKIAGRCASAAGATHRSFCIEKNYFPPRSAVEELVRETEFANHLQWYPLIKAVRNERLPAKQVILLGDLCESMVGLNVREFSSRKARRRSFINGLIRRPEQMPDATASAFRKWRERVRRDVTQAVLLNLDKLSDTLASRLCEKELADETAGDLDVSFARVSGNMPPFVPMFDELFYWFHRSRYLIAGQAQFLSSTFYPRCPAVSLRSLRLMSTVDPRLRIRRRLMDAIARLPDFARLARIPSAQIPWVSALAPPLLKDLVWGGRSGIDQLLIKRLIRSGNANRRQRVLRSLDYVKEYRRDETVAAVRDWFSGDWLRREKYLEILAGRASLSSWPLMALDISAPANISIILDLFKAHSPVRRAAIAGRL